MGALLAAAQPVMTQPPVNARPLLRVLSSVTEDYYQRRHTKNES